MKLTLILLLSSLYLFSQDSRSDINLYTEKLKKIDKSISNSSNKWLIAYDNYQNYKDILSRIEFYKIEIKKYKNSKNLKDKLLLDKYNVDIITLKNREKYLSKLDNIKLKDSLGGILVIKNINSNIDQDLTFFSALNVLNNLKNNEVNYKTSLKNLKESIELLKAKKSVLTNLNSITNGIWIKKLDKITVQLEYFNEKYLSLMGVNRVYLANAKIAKDNIYNLLKNKIVIVFYYISVVVILIVGLILFRFISRKIIKSHNKHYFTNKFLNIFVVFLVIVIFLSSQVSNFAGIVTVLGFVSAGIAIAMKDIFMSFFGWFYITISGVIKVGDRVKVIVNSGNDFAFGDVLDISFLRITVYEEISFTNLAKKSAGRVIFVPNNYIFTHMLANYSHKSMSTTWEEIEVIVTFDSDIDKAKEIISEIAERHSLEYMKMAEKQITNLRTIYNIRNIEIKPRLFTFIGDYGMKISCYFLTYAFATLKLKSDISLDVMKSLISEENIMLAYPTRHLVAMHDEDYGQMSRLKEDEL